jgi:proline iminopeptidase
MVGATRREVLTAGGTAIAVPLLVGPGCASVGTASLERPPISSGRPDGVRTGGSRRIPVDGRFEVWVKQVGSGSIPLLTLHGGPGFPHYYFECFEDFLPQDRIRFYYYDQLGCGFSDRPADSSLWTVNRFRDEVEQVRRGLGLERCVIYGQSWGGILAIEYALAYPQHVSRLVISNMTASYPSYVEYVGELRAAMPPDIDRALKSFEERGDYLAAQYQQLLMDHLYSKHICRLEPWPEPALRSLMNLNADIYNTIQGPSEFTVTGNAKDWDRWQDLHRLSMPTLLMVGRYDTMSVAHIERMGSLIPNSQVVVCENGSHWSMYDDQEAYFGALVPFLLKAADS